MDRLKAIIKHIISTYLTHLQSSMDRLKVKVFNMSLICDLHLQSSMDRLKDCNTSIFAVCCCVFTIQYG